MSKIAELCGIEPPNFEKVDFSSNPNFVFTPDTNYISRQLFDSEGNTVTVNSYIECDHYVSGGWDYSPLKNNEILLLDLLSYAVVFLLIITFSKSYISKFINL